MDTFRMACFVSVANNLSLSKAAREMFVSQPAMTAQMHALEEELDTTLLIRDKRQIQLTPMGAYVAEQYKQILGEIDEVKAGVKSVEKAAYGKLRVGFHGPAEWAQIHRLIMEFRRTHEEIELEVVIDFWNNLRAAVNQRTLDAVFVPLSEVKGMACVETAPMFCDYLCVVVSRQHPLASHPRVTVEEIRSENIILPDYSISPAFLTYFDHQMQRAGLSIKRMGQGNYSEATITLAASGLGITIMPRSFKTLSDAVVYVDLDEEIVLDIGLAWHTGAVNAALPSFVEFCNQWEWNGGELF